jgi:radical SAM superfamily enzyme YgiQ (UPF0313 family)
MKVLWLDINSSYSHSSVALPAIHAQMLGNNECEWVVVRGTINDDPGTLAAQVAEYQPDIIAATFWLFTHQMQIETLSRAVQLLENTKVICGGPEFLGNNEDFLQRHKFITAVLRGEGEISMPRWLDLWLRPDEWHSVEGLCWLSDDGKYHDNGIARVSDFASLHYPENSKFFKWDKPFVQLETTRGCFNTCGFCVSGGEKPVRQQSLEQVASRLENIHNHGIKDIRVLDRTFNYDTDRACKMLDLFSSYAGKMRFHLEIHPAMMSEQLKEKLKTLPKGLLHLEAGIQSLDRQVLESCGRKGSLKASLEGLKYLCSLDNIEVHADLIAGLPLYTLPMICNDVRTLAEMDVDELQLESLKVLPGTRMKNEADILQLKYSPLPPYEILRTPVMTPSELKTAMHISRMLDFYYNCHAWQGVIRKLISSDSDFIISFTMYLKKMMVLDSPLSLERRGLLLFDYCIEKYPQMLTDISVAWIKAGCSLKKKPAETIAKAKHVNIGNGTVCITDHYLEMADKTFKMEIRFGTPDPSHKYFILPYSEGYFLFGYDSQEHQPAPSFMAELQ